jgi:hypothetical protein
VQLIGTLGGTPRLHRWRVGGGGHRSQVDSNPPAEGCVSSSPMGSNRRMTNGGRSSSSDKQRRQAYVICGLLGVVLVGLLICLSNTTGTIQTLGQVAGVVIVGLLALASIRIYRKRPNSPRSN